MPHDQQVSREALREALVLSEEILADIELDRVALCTVALKTSRLARLLNDFDSQDIFRYEASGYPSTPTGVEPHIWRLAEIAGRVYQKTDPKSGTSLPYAYLESIEQILTCLETAKTRLQVSGDRNVSVSSANPQQMLFAPPGNALERWQLQQQIAEGAKQLAARRELLYSYVSRTYYELKFSSVAQDEFSTIRAAIQGRVAELIPASVHKFSSIHENLMSQNPEDWSNAVHSCRRVLQDLADALFPATNEERLIEGKDKSKKVKLGAENYINRLICFAEDHSSSVRFQDIVGSHLSFLGDRLDAVFRATQKGSHSIVHRKEANRFVVYTYLVISDLLSLTEKDGPSE
ncbi:hypothetical protein KQH82_06840 [bacterium]|nr:hypothetical protein [bacterium]